MAAVLSPLAASSQLPAWVCMSHQEPGVCKLLTSDLICEAPAATLKGQDSYGFTPATREYMLCICRCAALVETVLGSTFPKNDDACVDVVSWAAVVVEVEKG